MDLLANPLAKKYEEAQDLVIAAKQALRNAEALRASTYQDWYASKCTVSVGERFISGGYLHEGKPFEVVEFSPDPYAYRQIFTRIVLKSGKVGQITGTFEESKVSEWVQAYREGGS